VADLFVAEHPGPAGAPRVVLVHGSLDRSTAFLRTVRLLEDLEVVRYDRRGYGRSLHAGVCVTFPEQVDDLATVVAGRPTVLFGHSLGGVVALAFAARRPDLVPAVVAYEAPMAWQSWWPSATAGSVAMAPDVDEAAAAERFMRRMIGDERWAGLPERTREQRRAEGPALVAELRSIRPPAPPPYDPAVLTMPVIAAHGSQSVPHHQETARVLAAAAPHGELVVVEGAGHGVHLTHPAAVADLVRRAVARAEAAGDQR
jgi:pimeloyl-ACP methyl ester carboxylesterase